ncbi:MAG TPA: hypothetical protein VMH24_03265, partial [Candidatus Sulfotelmatobacter sp.]|nr:hypothetical protein [Candidatus Sulfotelmatobacter sp.]
AFRAGAIEAWLIPIQTRGGRTGAILSMVASPAEVEALLRLARGKADGGLVRILPVRRPD